MTPRTTEIEPISVVLAPEVLAKSLHDPHCQKVFELWRDGIIRVVVTRELLVTYLGLLKALGVPDEVLRRWAVWFTAETKSTVLLDSAPGRGGLSNSLEDAAVLGKAEAILYEMVPTSGAPSDSTGRDEVPRRTVKDFLAR